MRKILIAIVCAMLSACVYQTVNMYDIEEADKLCASHGGVVEISADAVGGETTLCKDNTRFILHKDNVK